MDSTDLNDTRLSQMHNTTLKTEEDSDEDVPLVKLKYYSFHLIFSSTILINYYFSNIGKKVNNITWFEKKSRK